MWMRSPKQLMNNPWSNWSLRLGHCGVFASEVVMRMGSILTEAGSFFRAVSQLLLQLDGNLDHGPLWSIRCCLRVRQAFSFRCGKLTPYFRSSYYYMGVYNPMRVIAVVFPPPTDRQKKLHIAVQMLPKQDAENVEDFLIYQRWKRCNLL